MYVCFINTEQNKDRKRGMCRDNQCFSMILGEITRKTTKKSYFRPKSSKKLQKAPKSSIKLQKAPKSTQTNTYLDTHLSVSTRCCLLLMRKLFPSLPTMVLFFYQ
jgi:hypothetical protein